jgi:hypothetical protein
VHTGTLHACSSFFLSQASHVCSGAHFRVKGHEHAVYSCMQLTCLRCTVSQLTVRTESPCCVVMCKEAALRGRRARPPQPMLAPLSSCRTHRKCATERTFVSKGTTTHCTHVCSCMLHTCLCRTVSQLTVRTESP